MNMGQASAGLGLGVRDVRHPPHLQDAEGVRLFRREGLGVRRGGTAAAAVAEKGGSVRAGEDFGEQVEKYGVAKNGLMFETTLTGTKYWKSSELN